MPAYVNAKNIEGSERIFSFSKEKKLNLAPNLKKNRMKFRKFNVITFSFVAAYCRVNRICVEKVTRKCSQGDITTQSSQMCAF